MGTGEFHASNFTHNKLDVTKSFSLIITARQTNTGTPTAANMSKMHPKIEFMVISAMAYTNFIFQFMDLLS